MGFFKKLFFGSDETETKYETPWYDDFFSVDLKKAPNSEWCELSSERNGENIIRNFAITGLHNSFFTEASAKIIGNNATNFFFKCSDSDTKAFDIFFKIENAVTWHGNLDRSMAIRLYKKNFVEAYQWKEWKRVDNCDILMTRDIETGGINIDVFTNFYNADFLEKKKENDVFSNIGKLSANNFFGIDMERSPNSAWTEQEKDFVNDQEIRNFRLNDPSNLGFTEVIAKVIGEKSTNFFFICPYSWDKAFEIYFMIERDLIHNGDIDLDKAKQNFVGKLDDCYDSVSWEKVSNCGSITLSRDIDTGDIELGIWSMFYNKAFLD